METAGTTLSRMRGLMFRKSCVPILFDFHSMGIWPIHSFFVRFKFDAIYLDSDWKAVAIYEGIPPFTACVSPSVPSRYLIELPSGSVKKLSAKIKDALRLGPNVR